MRARTQFRLLCVVLASCAGLAGCGRNATAPPSEGGENSAAARNAQPAEAVPEQQTEQKLDPLTANDVEVYLKVMQAAAERVKKAQADDQATLEAAKKILVRGAAGRVPTPDEVKTLERANLVALFMDQIIADEMKLDGRTYRGIAEAVEAAVPNPVYPVPPGGGSAVPLAPGEPPSALETRLSAVNAANRTFLVPYRAEIQRLVSLVRNPSNLPKQNELK